LLAFFSAVVAPLPAGAEPTIVVNFGRFRSAEAAAGAEAEVNWLDADATDDTACTECFAAVELQRYLRRITSQPDNFPMADDDRIPQGELILIGGPASSAAARRLAGNLGVDERVLAALGPQGYRIKTGSAEGRRVTLIAGGGRTGTLYGVYDLLHRLGARWFAPGEVHEEVPQAAWQPALDATERPSFVSRGFYIFDERGDPQFWLWMARNRLNDWSVEVRNPAFLRKLGFLLACGTHDAQWKFISPAAAYPYKHARFAADGKKPEDPYPPSREYQGDANKDGRLSYFEAHPEWYPQVGGRRVPGVGAWGGTNFCTSNLHATEEFTKNYVQALIDGLYAGADVVNFWTLDGGQWCECPACLSAGTPTDRSLRLVYDFDKQVKKAQREGRIAHPVEVRFLVYADVLNPPTRPLPADFDYRTCVATFYPISRCFVHEFDDRKCSRNAVYEKQLSGWMADPQRHYRGQLVIGEYYNVSRFKSLPLCLMHSMARDIPVYYKSGARSFQYMHVTTGRWGNKSLTNYQMARQLWDVKTDCEALWSDFFQRRYGPAAPPMRRFYESLGQMLSNVESLKGWRLSLAAQLNRGAKDLFVDPHLRYRREPGVACEAPTLVEMVEHAKACRDLITRAAAMPIPERIRARIAEDERMFTYGERTLAYYHECVQAFQLARACRRDEARGHYAEAKRLAGLLRKDTWSPGLAYRTGEPSPLDAFYSTFATQALTHLAALLEEPVSQPHQAGADKTLVGHWPLAGDCKDVSGRGNHGVGRNIALVEGPGGLTKRATMFNGRDSVIEVPDAASLHPGTGDFSICVWVKPEVPMRSVLGDILSKFDGKRRRGINFHLAGSSPAYNSMCDTRHVHFGVDDGYLGRWEDCGKPWPGNALVTCMVVFEGNLYCGIADAEDPKSAAQVFRWAGGKEWISCDRLGHDPNHLSVQSMIVHQGKLYAGTGIYDWDRARGKVPGSSPAAPTRVFVYEGGTTWRDLGQVGDGSRVLCMASFNGHLYVGLDAARSPGKCFRYDGSRWSDCGEPDGVNVQSLMPLGGTLYAATHGRVHRYEGGQKWTCISDRPFGVTQTHCLEVFRGQLLAGTWPQGYVLYHVGGTNWSHSMRLGLAEGVPECNEVNDLLVHNGSLYAGVLPKAEVYRREADGQWTLLASLARRPDWARNRLHSWCRVTALASFQGKLFACTGACAGRAVDVDPEGTLGRVYSIQAGQVASHERDIGGGWSHLAAVRQGRRLRLFVNGRPAASAEIPEGRDFDLSNDRPLTMGFGTQGHFSGALADLRLFARALDAKEPAQLFHITTESGK
jgi:hypothetical protein